MISRQDLERLASLKSDHGILAAYIPLDPRLRFVRQQAASNLEQPSKRLSAVSKRAGGKRLLTGRVLTYLISYQIRSRWLVAL